MEYVNSTHRTIFECWINNYSFFLKMCLLDRFEHQNRIYTLKWLFEQSIAIILQVSKKYCLFRWYQRLCLLDDTPLINWIHILIEITSFCSQIAWHSLAGAVLIGTHGFFFVVLLKTQMWWIWISIRMLMNHS